MFSEDLEICQISGNILNHWDRYNKYKVTTTTINPKYCPSLETVQAGSCNDKSEGSNLHKSANIKTLQSLIRNCKSFIRPETVCGLFNCSDFNARFR